MTGSYGNSAIPMKTHYAKCLHVWVIYDNCTGIYVIHLHYIVRYLLLS